MYFGGKEGMNAQNGKIKLVQNADARPKKARKRRGFGQNQNTSGKKARRGPRGGRCREMHGKRQFFRRKKIILVDSGQRIRYNDL